MKERQAKLVATPEYQRRKQKMKSQLANVVGTPEYEKQKPKVCFKKLQNTNSASLKIETFKKAIIITCTLILLSIQKTYLIVCRP